MRLASLLCVLPLAACASDAVSTTADQPLVGVDGSSDQADRGCNIILRTLERTGPSRGGYETNGASWVWSGTIEVSTAATAGLSFAPQILWSTDGVTWQAAAGTAVTDHSATPGFEKFSVQIDHGASGPASEAGFQVAAFLPLIGGGRLFDHNRNPGDFDNYTVAAPDYAIWDAQGTCKAATSPEQATLTFAADFTQTRTGVLAPGGTLAVAYETARLAQCAQEQGGFSQWDVTAHVQFDSGELLAASVRDATATFPIPTDGAKQVALWFEATSVSGCHAWDSNYGHNYVFALATPPQWLGLPTNTLSRDSSMRCGAADAATGFAFDTWARQRAVNTNLCFQVYQPGETDRDNPDLWQDLDTSLHWRLVGANGATAWAVAPVDFDSRQGNNASYAWSWRAIDPFRDYHCPEVASTPTPDGMSQQISVEYWIDVNGGELRPAPGAAYGGTFVDYPSNPWRAANCH